MYECSRIQGFFTNLCGTHLIPVQCYLWFMETVTSVNCIGKKWILTLINQPLKLLNPAIIRVFVKLKGKYRLFQTFKLVAFLHSLLCTANCVENVAANEMHVSCVHESDEHPQLCYRKKRFHLQKDQVGVKTEAGWTEKRLLITQQSAQMVDPSVLMAQPSELTVNSGHQILYFLLFMIRKQSFRKSVLLAPI